MKDYSDIVTDEFIENAVNMEGNPFWETFWLRIRIPPLKTPCELCREAEGSCRIDQYKYCSTCADYIENVTYCTDCNEYTSCPHPNQTCYKCHAAYVE